MATPTGPPAGPSRLRKLAAGPHGVLAMQINWTSAVVNVPASRLMIGLANGWAGGPSPKSVLIMPSDVAGAWSILGGNAPKGVGFWDMPDEGRIPAGQNASLYMARDLNTFLKTRTRMKNVDL